MSPHANNSQATHLPLSEIILFLQELQNDTDEPLTLEVQDDASGISSLVSGLRYDKVYKRVLLDLAQ